MYVAAPLQTTINAVLGVRACNSPEDAAWIRVRVRYVKQTNGGCEFGCQFLDSLTSALLRQFG
jgi:hypothetical protein